MWFCPCFGVPFLAGEIRLYGNYRFGASHVRHSFTCCVFSNRAAAIRWFCGVLQRLSELQQILSYMVAAIPRAKGRTLRAIIDNILVIGHHNPDTDASASAVSYAALLNRLGRYDQPVLGCSPGELTPQARFVFEQAGVSEPVLVTDVAPLVGHVCTQQATTLDVDQRVGDAIECLVRSDLSMLPVLTNEGKLHGIFSNRNDASRFLLGFDPTPMWGTLLSVEDLASMNGMNSVGSVQPEERLDGELRVALDGDQSWRQVVAKDDVVVCGSLQSLDEIADAKLPQTVVVVSDTDLRGSQRVAKLNAAGVAVLQFEQGIAQFLLSLSVHIRLGLLNLPSGPSVGMLDRVEDIRMLLLEHHHALPVLGDDGTFQGVISIGDLSKPERSKVILVDHFERPQTVDGLDDAEVLEILDHHRVGDIQSSSPIRVECRPVGSSCTIVASEFFDNGITPDRGIATLLLGGIVADTLVLRGPTTTDSDRKIAPRLAEIAGVILETFGRDVLVAGDDLLSSEPQDIWDRDQKQFSIRNQNFAVAQLETASLEKLPSEKLNAFRELVTKDRERNNRLLSMLVLTDVLSGNSWMYSSESTDAVGVVGETFSKDEPVPEWISAPGIVSRKKQIVPRVMQALAN